MQGWPTRDESKWNTLAKLASPPAPNEPRKLTGADHRRRRQGRQAGGRPHARRLVSCLPRDGAGRRRQPAGQCRPRSVGDRQCRLSTTSGCSTTSTTRASTIRRRSCRPGAATACSTTHEINDMVAFLKTLKSPAVFKTVLDDPNKRPAPVEKRENLDADGKSRHVGDRQGGRCFGRSARQDGFSCNTCHNDPKAAFKTWAASMPKWEPRLEQGAGRRGIHHAPRQGHHRRQTG